MAHAVGDIAIQEGLCNTERQGKLTSLDGSYYICKANWWDGATLNEVMQGTGKAPLILDSKKPTIPVAEYIYTENRYKQLTRNNPEVAKKLADDLQKEVDARYAFYDAMSKDTEGLISL